MNSIEQKNDKKGHSMIKETRKAQTALIIGVVLMVFLPVILTQKFGFVSFMNTGPIGDTIGGITAPISGLLGAYLVFLALKAQVEANRIVMDEVEKQAKVEGQNRNRIFLQEIIRQINIELSRFSYKSRQGAFLQDKEGLNGFIEYITAFDGNFEQEEYYSGSFPREKYTKILKLFQYFLNKLNDSGFPKDDIEYHSFLFRSEFYDKIETDLNVNFEENMNFGFEADDPGLILTREILKIGEDLDRMNL